MLFLALLFCFWRSSYGGVWQGSSVTWLCAGCISIFPLWHLRARGPQPVGTLPSASYECGDLEKSGLPFCEMSAGHHFMCGHSQYVGADTWIDALLAHNRTACSAGLVPVPSASEATWPMEGSQGERGREGCRQGSPFPAFSDNGLRFCADCIPCAQCSGLCLGAICACHAGPE